MEQPRFADRRAAGRELAERVAGSVTGDVVVVAVPLGGIELADEVAATLGAPLDVAEVLEVPGKTPEVGLGVVTPDGERNVHRATARAVGVDDEDLDERLHEQHERLRAVVDAVRHDRPREPVDGRIVAVVDDTLSNLSESVAAADDARSRGASHVVLAVAVAAEHFAGDIEDRVELVCVERAGDIVRPEDWFGRLDVPDADTAARIIVERAAGS